MDEKEMKMVYSRETNLEKVTSEILDVLAENKITIGMLDTVFENVKGMATFNTCIQNPKETTQKQSGKVLLKIGSSIIGALSLED